MIHVVPIHVFNTVMLVSLAAAVLATPFTSIVIQFLFPNANICTPQTSRMCIRKIGSGLQQCCFCLFIMSGLLLLYLIEAF